jgi:hypothetical protein
MTLSIRLGERPIRAVTDTVYMPGGKLAIVYEPVASDRVAATAPPPDRETFTAADGTGCPDACSVIVPEIVPFCAPAVLETRSPSAPTTPTRRTDARTRTKREASLMKGGSEEG